MLCTQSYSSIETTHSLIPCFHCSHVINFADQIHAREYLRCRIIPCLSLIHQWCRWWDSHKKENKSCFSCEPDAAWFAMTWGSHKIIILSLIWRDELSWSDKVLNHCWLIAGGLNCSMMIATVSLNHFHIYSHCSSSVLVRGSKVITQDFDIRISSLIASRLQVKKFWDSWKRWISDHEKPQHDDHNEKGDAALHVSKMV